MVRTLSLAGRFIFALIRRLVRYLFRGATILLIAFLLAFNVATLTVGSLNAFLSSVIETVSGFDTLRTRSNAEINSARTRAASAEADLKKSKAKTAELDGNLKKTRAHLDLERGRTKYWSGKTAELDGNLKKTRAHLDLERGRTKYWSGKTEMLEGEVRRLGIHGPDVKFRGTTRTMRSVVEETTVRIEERTAKVAVTNVASMAGEGIPFWGIAVIVAATGLEVASACETMQDMHDLTLALSPASADSADVQSVCGLPVQTRQEIWTKIKASPAAVWASVSEIFTGLPSPDFSGAWAWLVDKFSWN